MTETPEVSFFRNGIFLSQSPSKKFGLVEVEGVTRLASKDPEQEIPRGKVITVRLSNKEDPKIV